MENERMMEVLNKMADACVEATKALDSVIDKSNSNKKDDAKFTKIIAIILATFLGVSHIVTIFGAFDYSGFSFPTTVTNNNNNNNNTNGVDE